MRIGIVCPYAWDVPGGVQFHIRDMAEVLIARGHEVTVLAPAESDEGLPDYVCSTGKPVAVPYNGSVARLNIGVRSTSRVRSWIRESDLDVMHVHEPMAPGVSTMAIWAARGPIVATWHSSMERSRLLEAGFGVAQTIMEKTRGRIAVSELARQTLVDHLGGDAVLIPNGVACEHYAEAEPLPGYRRGDATLVFLGRIDEPRKGLQVLLPALPAIAAEHPDLRVIVAGPGDQEAVLKGLPADVAERLDFLGLVSEEDKVRAYHSADLYVAPNTGGESFGIVLLEAMSAGTAVLASDLDAFSRVLDRGKAGRLFHNGDSADLARAANELLADAEERERLAGAGLERAWLFDWGKVADEVIDVYESVRTPGEKVTEDLRGQFVGRLAGRSPGESRVDRGSGESTRRWSKRRPDRDQAPEDSEGSGDPR